MGDGIIPGILRVQSIYSCSLYYVVDRTMIVIGGEPQGVPTKKRRAILASPLSLLGLGRGKYGWDACQRYK
jgi:hypothetical protein